MTKILLIEDNIEVRENTAEILGLADYEVLTAENGKRGVEQAKSFRPDLIICDIMMPELDGYGVLHILGKNAETSGIPFIFLTAKADKADVRKGMNLGADDYLTKPFEETDLLDAIETRLKKVQKLNKTYDKSSEMLDSFITSAKAIHKLEDLSANRKTRTYKKKTNIFLEGDTTLYVFFVRTGKVKTVKTNADGKEFITDVLGEGDFLGYTDVLKNHPHTESAMAMEDTEVSLIPKSDFDSLIYDNRDVASQFIKLLSDNISEKEEQLLHLAYNSVRQRVAEALLQLMKGPAGESDPPDAISISREDLANMVGTAPESVIRTLSDFKEENIITVKSSKIVINNPTSLKRVMQGFVR